MSLLLLAALQADPADLFSRRVHPALKLKCFGCHGEGPELKADLDLTSRAGMLKGGASGKPALVAGHPEQSRLFQAARRDDPDLAMPPKERDRLTADELDALRAWIAGYSPWPASPGAGEEHWAFQPIRRPPVPPGASHPIDAFIEARLREKKLTPGPPADARTLARRVAFDLTGLPPPEDAQEFPALVERLLADPRYGEQQARHWLDIVRYADTAGFSNDFERPHAWRYRDYVVRAFNDDKPFGRFVLEQLAGDEMDPNNPEALIAVGFLRMGPWEQTAMSVAAVTRQFFLDDVTHQTAATFLGLTMRCARCHDHKFDPIPSRDYYRLQAVFAPTQFAERPAAFLPRENTAGFEEARALVDRRLKDPATRPDGAGPDDPVLRKSLDKIVKKRAEHLSRERRRTEPLALSVYNGPPATYLSNALAHPVPERREGAIQEISILRGGALESPGERVGPGVPEAVRGPAPPEFPSGGDGRRLTLARWIADPNNPLTARVIVNRVWQHHFGGRGLVATPNNFGKMGRRPSHPELLDWLASWFLDNGGSFKALHRLIVTSETYRRADGPSDEWLAHYPPRRLEAEELRDAMLRATGELRETAGGPGVFPELHWEVALQPRHVMGGPAPAYQPSPLPEERHRRSIYAFRIRTLSDPWLDVFDRPGSDLSCERRDETTVTPQAFALFNSRFSHDRALAMARRIEGEGAGLDRAFALAYGRGPTDEERLACRGHVERMAAHHRARAPERIDPPTSVRRQMIEEFTGETVRWIEDLDLMKGFRPDLKPWDVGPETRALAEICLVLLNSNEFIYVR